MPSAVRSALENAHARAAANPNDAEAVGRLGMMLHAYEQHGLASDCYERARQSAPAALRWTYLSGVVAAELGDTARAVPRLRAAVEMDAAYLPARLKLAEALLEHGELAAGRAEYEALIRAFPELAAAYYGLGRALSALGDTPAATEAYARALVTAPQFGRAHYALALAHRDTGHPDQARTHLDPYRRYGSSQPSVPDPLLEQVRSMRGTARDLIARGAEAGNENRLREAIDLHLEALELDPTASQAHANLISLYGRMGDPEQAEAHYRKAIALQTSLATAHYNYGVLLAGTGWRSEAAASFQRALEVDPFHAQAHNNVAALLASEGRAEEAASHYRQALASDPQHQNARFGLAGVLLALGRPREAVVHLEKLLQQEGADAPRFKYALFRAWLAAGDMAKARAHAEDALDSAIRAGQTALAARIREDLRRLAAGER